MFFQKVSEYTKDLNSAWSVATITISLYIWPSHCFFLGYKSLTSETKALVSVTPILTHSNSLNNFSF